MGETVEIVFLTSLTAPYPYSNIDQTATVSFQYKSHVVGVDVVETGENSYTLSLVCIRDQFAPAISSTRFFKITNGASKPVLNNDVMYVGAAQIRTYHSSYSSGPQNMHVYTLHVFEESVS